MIKYSERLRELGVSDNGIGVERESWVMVAARVPELVEEWMVHKYQGLEDPAFVQLYLHFDAAFHYDVDDRGSLRSPTRW